MLTNIKKLCAPALVYLVISLIGISCVLFQNLGNTNSYHVGTFSCRVPNTAAVLFIKLVYVVFWTYILNLICNDGHAALSWALILLPWILLFVMMGLLMMNM
jgi:hypothetical protein